MSDLYMDAHRLNQEPPKKLYVWVVSQDGEHRIRKWDTKPFDEATHICDSEEHTRPQLDGGREAWDNLRDYIRHYCVIIHPEKNTEGEEPEKVILDSLDALQRATALQQQSVDVGSLLRKYVPADHPEAKDPWLTENEVKAYNLAVREMLRKGYLHPPLEKVEGLATALHLWKEDGPYVHENAKALIRAARKYHQLTEGK